MIDLNKKYTTKNGFEVKLFEIIGDRVFGVYNHLKYGWQPTKWNIFDGAHGTLFGYELVEIPQFQVSGFNQEQICKEITVYGQYMIVPVWAKYVFVSNRCFVYVSEKKPELSGPSSWDYSSMGTFEKVGEVGVTKGHIKDSLVEV
jgi:hypothetical protein